MKKILFFLSIFSIIISCSTVGNKKCMEINEKLTSENRLFVKKVSLLQRENSVYKYENIQYRRNLGNKIAEVEKLQSEVASIKDKFENDISLWEKKYGNLADKNRILEKESSEKIRELTELNHQLELRLGKEIKRLIKTARSKDEKFGRERELLKKGFAKREYNLLKGIEDLKKKISGLEKESSETRIRINDLSIRLENAMREIGKKNSIIKDLRNAVPPDKVIKNRETGESKDKKK